jgi:hypothetical protein
MTEKTRKDTVETGAGNGAALKGSVGGWIENAAGTPAMKTFRGWHILEPFPVKGGEADVFLVAQGDEQRVLKIYRYGITPKPEVLQKVATLSAAHPNVLVRVIEFARDPESQCYYEFEEYIAGGNLADLLLKTPLTEPEIQKVIKHLAFGLGLLHGENVLHLDLKPANVLVRDQKTWSVVLSDFGISSIFDTAYSKKVTQTKGTSLYQSPESITGVVLPQTDWWSLGIMALEMLLKRHPFEGLQRQVILYQLTTRGVQIPETIDERWRLLLMGLLTRNPVKRWGYEQVRDWFSGQSPPAFYHEELAAAGNAEGVQTGLDLSADIRRFETILTVGGQPCATLESFFQNAFAAPDAWEESKKCLCRGDISRWLEKNGDESRAKHLRKLLDEETNPDLLLFRAGIALGADLAFAWRGRPMDEARLLFVLEQFADGAADEADTALIKPLFDGSLLQQYVRCTGKNLGKLESFWKTVQALKGTEFEKLDSREKARLAALGHHGDFAVNRAFEFLRHQLERPAAPDDRLPEFLQKRGLAALAQRLGWWQPGDGEIWNICLKALNKKILLQDTVLDGFFAAADQAVPALKADAALREFVGKILTRSDSDLSIIKNVQAYLPANPWLEWLIRGVYRFPQQEKLEFCFGALMLSSSVNQRWSELGSQCLLPPFLNDIKLGRVVSPATAALTREILENPDLLPERTTDFPTWESLESMLSFPDSMVPATREYLQFAKTHQKRLSVGSLGELFGKAFGYLVLGVIAMVAIDATFPRRYSGGRFQAREKSCYANMRVILGAVEMYNMDNTVMVSTNLDLGMLQQQGYIKSAPQCPTTGGFYFFTGDMTKDGKVKCSTHETVD